MGNLAALLYLGGIMRVSVGFSTPISFHSYLNSVFFRHGILGNFPDLDTSQGKQGKRATTSCILVLVLSLSLLQLCHLLISYLCTNNSAVLIIFNSPVLRLNHHFYLFAAFSVLKSGIWCLCVWFHCPLGHQISTNSWAIQDKKKGRMKSNSVKRFWCHSLTLASDWR